MNNNLSYGWAIITVAVIVLELIAVSYFVPTISIPTPQEEKYLLPWQDTFNVTGFPVVINLEVHDLIWPDRATPQVNDPIVYSFNITNVSNENVKIYHRASLISPIVETFANESVELTAGQNKEIDTEKVVLREEGVNEIDFLFNITNTKDSLSIEHYVWAISPQTENSIVFGKYGQILTEIVLIPSTVIAIKNFKDLTTKRPKKSERKDYSASIGDDAP